MDPYTSGFYIADTLEDTLLGYVMANRQLQENARQFDRNLAENARQYDTTFAEGKKQFDTTFAEEKRKYDDRVNYLASQNMGEKIMGEQIITNARLKEQRQAYDRSKRQYMDAQKKKLFGLGFNKQRSSEQFEREVGPRPQLRQMQLPNFPFLPQYGLDRLIQNQSPQLQQTNLLRTLMLGGR